MIEQSTTNAYYIDGSWCTYRLPCGICEKLGRACLKMNNETTITWGTSISTDSAPKITYSPVAPATSFGEETV